VEGFCEHGNEPLGSIKCWEFLEWLHNWQLLKTGSAPLVSDLLESGKHAMKQSTQGKIILRNPYTAETCRRHSIKHELGGANNIPQLNSFIMRLRDT
jgi:hypothetical protein